MTASSGSENRQNNVAATFALPPDATAAAAARSYVRRLLERWSLRSIVEPLSLVVSELAANAARYGRPPFVLLLRRLGSGVRVEMHDESPEFHRKFPDPDVTSGEIEAEGGRGLRLVQAVSSAAGVEHIPDDGKRVWAVVEPDDRTSDK
jgi:anti-sigma regulatory factor (Ser/Thr protein kinase)